MTSHTVSLWYDSIRYGMPCSEADAGTGLIAEALTSLGQSRSELIMISYLCT